MDSPKAKVRARIVKRELPTSEDVAKFSEEFSAMVEAGDFDSHLDVLWKAVDARLAVYFDYHGKGDTPQERRVEKIRRMRKGLESIVIGNFYGIFGEKYAGVVVHVLGHVEETENSDVPKVRVKVVEGNAEFPAGPIYKLVIGALENITNGYSQQHYRSLHTK